MTRPGPFSMEKTMTISMRALRTFPGPYQGRMLRPGDEFTAVCQRDAKVFQATGQAALVEAGQYKTRVMTAEAAPAPTAARENLDAMDLDALRALAARMGVKVHHNAGARKVRQAILEARA